ncbi:uncharacterized protein LOC110453308 [Mizuhopecten yessoensis]|uniref:uncharacterized protein LOC110453308 n=1 Tax=Mizuhopecten yessoensis TaxID=6573 RepID=UPI000B45E480|nr:uncharacterized protein LOC110453308 [Mizuhopecten yessoensis]
MVVSHGAGPPVRESHTDDHNSRLYESQHRKSIQGVILNLQRSYDVDLVQASLRKLQVLAHKREVHQFLANKEVHQCIMTAVSHLDLHKNIQKLGCEVLADLVERITDLCATFSQSTTLGQLLEILHTNAFSDAELHLSIMRILARLLDREEIRNQLIMDDGVTDMADILYNTIVTFNDNRYILVPTFTALRHLLSEDNDLQESFMQEKWELVMQCLTTFTSSPEVTQAVLELLGVIAANDQLMDSLVAENIQELVVDRCASMRSSGSMASTCCSLLCRLCASDSVKEFVTAENFLRTTLVPLMYEQRSNVAVQHHGLILLCLLLKYNFSQNDEQNSLDLGPLYDWCDLVNIAMSKHLDNIDVQICSCRAISALMEYRPEARRWIGLDVVDGQNQLPIHTLCLGAILMFRQKSEVFVAACEAIYWLAADNETLSGQLMERNCHVAIIDGLTVHLSEPWAVEAGCKAIRGLCIFHEAYKHVVIRDGIQALITKAMNKFPENPEIQIEVISMLACLGDVDVVRYQCFIDGIHSKILTNLDSFKDNEILQEASLECLSVLSTVVRYQCFIDGIHSKILTNLDSFKDNEILQEASLECISVLSTVGRYTDGLRTMRFYRRPVWSV